MGQNCVPRRLGLGKTHSKSQDLIGFLDQVVQIVHPGNGAGAGAHQTVGFEADPSDVKITFELFHLPHDVEGLGATLFKGHALASMKTPTSSPWPWRHWPAMAL